MAESKIRRQALMIPLLLYPYKMAHLRFAMALLALGMVVPSAVPQAAAPIFDVATIKRNTSGSRSSSSLTTNHGTYTAENITLRALLPLAFGVRQDLIFGLPGWAEEVHFDINAKSIDHDANDLAALNREQRRAMMQALLADRFQLTSHMEVRTLPVYELVVAKGGTKFKESSPASGDRSGTSIHNNELTATSCPMAIFINVLTDNLHRAVVDKTGLAAKYDFTLKWARDEVQASPGAEASDDAGPSIFTAIQEQLGLKLQPAKGPVEVLVIDHIEQPSEN
jgi:uncharacterized protein (TIGR03435 family)